MKYYFSIFYLSVYLCLEWTEIIKNGYPDVCISHIFILMFLPISVYILYCRNHPFISPWFLFFSLVSRSFCSMRTIFPLFCPSTTFSLFNNYSLAVFLRTPFLPIRVFLNLVYFRLDSSLIIPSYPVLMLDLPPYIVTSSRFQSTEP